MDLSYLGAPRAPSSSPIHLDQVDSKNPATSSPPLPTSSLLSLSLSQSQVLGRLEEDCVVGSLSAACRCMAINTRRGGWEPEPCGTHMSVNTRGDKSGAWKQIPKHLHELAGCRDLSMSHFLWLYNQRAAVA